MTLETLLSHFTDPDEKVSINVLRPELPNGVLYIPDAGMIPKFLRPRMVRTFWFELEDELPLLMVELKEATT